MKEFLKSQNLLQTVADGAKRNSETARQLFSNLSEAQLNWKPAPEQWSIAQCLEHLSVGTSKFEPYFTSTIDRARRVAVTPGYRPSFMGGWLAKMVAPQSARKLRAPKVFQPSESSTIQGSLEEFLKAQDRFLQFVRKAEGIDYNKARLRSPVTPLMRYSLADAFVIIVVHAQRHIAQAQRVRESVGFPNS